MIRLCLVASLAAGAAVVQAQPAPPIQPSVDSPEQRQMLRAFTTCLAEQRPAWARRTLAHPYLSPAQARTASEVLNGRDTCLRGPEAQFTFRTSSLVASLAEHYLRTELDSVEGNRLVAALNTLPPLNVSEEFALCVSSRNPAAARNLALSEFGSEEEADAGRQLAGAVEACTLESERLTVDLQALRALAATALYRGVSAVKAGNN